MLDLDIADYRHKNRLEHNELERRIDKLNREVRNLKDIINDLKSKYQQSPKS